MDLKLRGFPPKHRRLWLVGFEAQKVLAWRLLKGRFSVVCVHALPADQRREMSRRHTVIFELDLTPASGESAG
jgi:hypothetical protein